MEEQKFDVVAHARGLIGMLVGGVAGFFLFQWLVSQGFYGLAIPGAVMGLACGYASRIHSPVLAVACAIGAILLLPFAEWKVLPFVADDSFSYFLAHMHQLKPLTWIMFALGVVFAAWFGLGRPKTL
ncbi:MAG: hypothetical protein SFV81_30640 [Pirellulaceae bacterium]|nr:hypothetical protein [Pirellulaceae bacterium]